MPRVPMLDKFSEYVFVGKELAHLHLHYESLDVTELPISVDIRKEEYSVQQMRFKKVGKEKRKDVIEFNDYITISDISEEYKYVVNGKSAIEWVMERYAISVDKDSGIKDDPNLYSDNPKYIYELLLKVIAMSIITIELRESLPEYKEI